MIRLLAVGFLTLSLASCAGMGQRKYANRSCAHTTGSLLCGDEDGASENVTSDSNGPGLVAKTIHSSGN